MLWAILYKRGIEEETGVVQIGSAKAAIESAKTA
jgi:hypothetical protein